VGDRNEIGPRWAGRVSEIAESAIKNLLGKWQLKRSRHRWEENSEMDFEGDGF